MKIIFLESFFVGGKPGLYLKCYQNKPNENKSNRNKTKTKQIRKKNRDNRKSKKTSEEKTIKNINNKSDKKHVFCLLFYNRKPKYFGGNVIISHW